MDFVEALEIEQQVIDDEDNPPPRRRRFKNRTCEVFYVEMVDFEFKRTFRFSKAGVQHITALLGKHYA